MSIIEALKDFILQCPYLDELKKVNVDFLPSDPDTYSIEEEPSQAIIREFVDGSSERQFVFTFASRMTYNNEVANNISNSGFFENFQNWLEECTENDVFPELDEGLTPYKIEALSTSYLIGINGDLQNARYQIQCRLLYDKE
ncbi:MAG: chloramphenicol resistance protein [Clostridiales bacterium]|nr:chloramphenicol resistance protein [Clostridiales bacterium]